MPSLLGWGLDILSKIKLNTELALDLSFSREPLREMLGRSVSLWRELERDLFFNSLLELEDDFDSRLGLLALPRILPFALPLLALPLLPGLFLAIVDII